MIQQTLRKHLNERGVTIYKFHKESGINLGWLYSIVDNADANISRDSMMKIYNATYKLFGRGLYPHEYLNIDN